MRNSEHTLADLKFLNNQYMQKIKSHEKESKEKSDRIQQLQEKNFHAVVQTPGHYFFLGFNLTFNLDKKIFEKFYLFLVAFCSIDMSL